MIINIYTTKFGNIFKEFVIINSYFNIDLSLLEDLLVRNFFGNSMVKDKQENYLFYYSSDNFIMDNDIIDGNIISLERNSSNILKIIKENNTIPNTRLYNLNSVNARNYNYSKKINKLLQNIKSKYITNYQFPITISGKKNLVFYGKYINYLFYLLKNTISTDLYEKLSFYDNLGKNTFLLISNDNLEIIYSEIETILSITNQLDNITLELKKCIQSFYSYKGFSYYNIKLINYIQLYFKGLNEKINWMYLPISTTSKSTILDIETNQKKLSITYYSNQNFEIFSKSIFCYNKIIVSPVYHSIEEDWVRVDYVLSPIQLTTFKEQLHIEGNVRISIKPNYIKTQGIHYERFGYDLQSIRIIGDTSKYWTIFLNNDFLLDLESGIWIKNLYSFKDIDLLNNLDITELDDSKINYLSKSISTQLYLDNHNQIYNNLVVYYKVFNNEFKNLLTIIPNEIPILTVNKNNMGSLENISITICQQQSLLIWKFDFDLIADNLEIFRKLLANNRFIGYDIKSIITILIRTNLIDTNNIFDYSLHDVLLQAWIYNPVINKIREFSEIDFIDDYSPQDFITDNISTDCYLYKGFELGTLFQYYISKDIFYQNITEISDSIKSIYEIYSLNKFFIDENKLRQINKLSVYERELDTVKVFSLMENRGIHIDSKNLKYLYDTKVPIALKENHTKLQNFIDIQFPEQNIQLPKEGRLKFSILRDLIVPGWKSNPPTLYDSNLIFPYCSYKTIDRKYSNKEFFIALMDRNESIRNDSISKLFDFIKLWIKYNSYQYIYSNFLKNLLLNMDKNSNIYPCIKIFGSNRGRLLTVNPNIHFAPNSSRTKLGKCTRRLFISRPGYTYIIADWTAQELATIGYLTGDQVFIKEYNEKDLHISTALAIIGDDTKNKQKVSIISDKRIKVINSGLSVNDKIYLCTIENDEIFSQENKVHEIENDEILLFKTINIPRESNIYFVTYSQRNIAKRFNFGVMYGIKPQTYSEELQIDKPKIIEYMDKWKQKWKFLDNFIIQQKQKTLNYGYNETLDGRGRRMYYNETISDNKFILEKALENSINYLNSGTAADLLRSVLVDIQKMILGMDAYIVHTMHDEIIIEVHDSLVEELQPKIQDIMENPSIFNYKKPHNFKLKVDLDICKWWDSCNVDKDDKIINNYECPQI